MCIGVPATGRTALPPDFPKIDLASIDPSFSGLAFFQVRSVYWLTAADSRRLIAERKYRVAADAELAVMVISDR